MFAGESNLSSNDTLVLGVRNLSDTGHTTYLTPVNNWQTPADLAEWSWVQFFGSGNTSVGQRFLVSVIAMPTRAVQTALAKPANRPTWAVSALPSGSDVKKRMRFTRVSGSGPAGCR